MYISERFPIVVPGVGECVLGRHIGQVFFRSTVKRGFVQKVKSRERVVSHRYDVANISKGPHLDPCGGPRLAPRLCHSLLPSTASNNPRRKRIYCRYHAANTPVKLANMSGKSRPRVNHPPWPPNDSALT
jgi:hypothetical protein